MDPLYLSQSIVGELLEHARAALPKECVGLLFGCVNEVRRRAPLTNIAKDSARYFAAPDELFAALQKAEARGDDLLAIYHSHPNARQTLSETDKREAYYGVAHLIVVPQLGVLRAFTTAGEPAKEVDLVVRDGF